MLLAAAAFSVIFLGESIIDQAGDAAEYLIREGVDKNHRLSSILLHERATTRTE